MAPQVPTTPDDAQALFAQLEASKSANPDAHNFDNIVTPDDVEQAQDANVAITVSEMAGEDGKPIQREGITFYPRSPKLRDLDDMTDKLGALQASGLKQGAAMMNMACFCLVVEDASIGKRRRATFDEIADNFDLADVELLSRLTAKYLNINVTPTTGDNAPKNA